MTPTHRLPSAIYLVSLYALLVLVYLGPQQTLAVDVLLTVIAYGGARIYSAATATRPCWGLLMFWLATLFMLLIPGVVQLSDASYFWPTPGSYAPAEARLAAVILGLGALLTDWSYCGFARLKSDAWPFTTPDIKLTGIVEQRSFRWLAWLGVGWTTALLIELGPSFFLRPRGAVATDLADSFSLPVLGLFYTLGSALLATLLVLATSRLRQPLTAADRRSMLRWLSLLAACNLLINFPGAQARYPVLATLLMMMLVVFRQTRREAQVSRWLAMLFAPLLYGVVRFQGAFNRDTGYDFGGAMRAAGDLRATLHHGDFDGVQMTILGVRYVAAQGHTWGQQLLSALLFFIPRAWWPDKAVPTGSLLAGYEHFTYTNLSAPLWLEGWLDFSWLGLIGISLCAGWLIQRADTVLNDAESLKTRQLLAIALIAFLPILLRGALLAVIAPVAGVFFWLWVSAWPANRARAAR